MKDLTILLVPETGKTVSAGMKQAIMNYLGSRNAETKENAPAIKVRHDLSHEDKCNIVSMIRGYNNCAAFFIYSENEEGTCNDYADLNIIYNDSNND